MNLNPNLITILCLMVFLGFATACSTDSNHDENEKSETLKHPLFKRVSISEIKTSSGAPNNKVTETFDYDSNGQLTLHTITQEISGNTYITTYTVKYTHNSVTIENNLGDRYIYDLNANGVAQTAAYYTNTILAREYVFEYTSMSSSEIPALQKMTESIDQSIFSTITFTPSTNNTAIYTLCMNGNTDTVNMIFEGSNSSLLPNHFFIESHPLSLHKTAIYARILGVQTMWLSELRPTGLDETTKYIYETDTNGWPSLCLETIHSYGVDYKREFKYEITLYTEDEL